MSTIPLSIQEERLERSIFEAIRKECVDKGYLPDVSNISLYPNTPQGNIAFKNALTNIALDKGFAIEVFGTGNSQAKGVKQMPRIVVDSNGSDLGGLGGDPSVDYVKQGDSYIGYTEPSQSTDFFTNIILTANTQQQYRVLHSILTMALPKRGYINYYDDPTEYLFIQNTNHYLKDNDELGIIEMVFTYTVFDIFDSEHKEVLNGISAIKYIETQKQLDNQLSISNSGTLSVGVDPTL